MSPTHDYYLGLGSNIEPRPNLLKAIDLLAERGEIREFSSVWETQAVGSPGPNFLNLCLRYESALEEEDLKRLVLLPIESSLGRVRTRDKNAPRTIDIDVLMADGRPVNPKRWAHAFVVVPLSELLPDFKHPLRGQSLAQAAAAATAETWIVRRADVPELGNRPAET